MKVKPLKATVIGGLVFLVPVIILFVVMAKVFEVMGLLAAPFSAWIPVDSIGGVATANIVTVILILIICYAAGLIASLTVGQKLYRTLDEKLLLFFPRYAFVKGMTDSIGADAAQNTLQPVLVSFDDQSQIAFEVERSEGGLVTIYLPGAPDPWSGAVAHVTADRVKVLDTNFQAVVKSFRKAGVGSNVLLD